MDIEKIILTNFRHLSVKISKIAGVNNSETLSYIKDKLFYLADFVYDNNYMLSYKFPNGREYYFDVSDLIFPISHKQVITQKITNELKFQTFAEFKYFVKEMEELQYYE